jgi:Ion channel
LNLLPQLDEVDVAIPLLVGAVVVSGTILIHAVPLSLTVRLVREETKLGRMGANFWSDFKIVALVISFALVAHLIEIGLWAVLFFVCGEFKQMGTAYYHSAVNYTTLGYGDLIMSPRWKLLGPLEAADGTLMFGVSTAMIFALIMKMIQTRFVDLRE